MPFDPLGHGEVMRKSRIDAAFLELPSIQEHSRKTFLQYAYPLRIQPMSYRIKRKPNNKSKMRQSSVIFADPGCV